MYKFTYKHENQEPHFIYAKHFICHLEYYGAFDFYEVDALYVKVGLNGKLLTSNKLFLDKKNISYIVLEEAINNTKFVTIGGVSYVDR